MVTEDRKLPKALGRVKLALVAMGSGDPEPYISCWAESEDAALFGAWGPIDKGHRRLAKTFRWVEILASGVRSLPTSARLVPILMCAMSRHHLACQEFAVRRSDRPG